MSKLPSDPYASVPFQDKVKLQSYVPPGDKDRLMLVLPDRNLFTLLCNHALKRAVDLCNQHNLQYSAADQQRLITFIVTGSDPVGPSVATTPSPTRNGLRKRTPARPDRATVPPHETGGSTAAGATPANAGE